MDDTLLESWWDRCKDGGGFLSQIGVLLKVLIAEDPRGRGFCLREVYVNVLSW